MLFRKNRVEEDLQKIRKANIPEKENAEKENFEKENAEKDDLNLERGDILAMILAVMSLILPYVFVFFGIMGAAILIMKFIWG